MTIPSRNETAYCIYRRAPSRICLTAVSRPIFQFLFSKIYPIFSVPSMMISHNKSDADCEPHRLYYAVFQIIPSVLTLCHPWAIDMRQIAAMAADIKRRRFSFFYGDRAPKLFGQAEEAFLVGLAGAYIAPLGVLILGGIPARPAPEITAWRVPSHSPRHTETGPRSAHNPLFGRRKRKRSRYFSVFVSSVFS